LRAGDSGAEAWVEAGERDWEERDREREEGEADADALDELGVSGMFASRRLCTDELALELPVEDRINFKNKNDQKSACPVNARLKTPGKYPVLGITENVAPGDWMTR